MRYLSSLRTFFKDIQLDTLARHILQICVILLPIIVVPGVAFIGQSVKYTTWVALVATALLCYVIARVRDLAFTFPGTIAKGVLLLLSLLAFVSSLFSVYSFNLSFFGTGSDVASGASLLLLVITGFLGFVYYNSKKGQIRILELLTYSFVVAGIYQLVAVLLPYAYKGYVFASQSTDNLVGKWYDFIIYAGLAVLTSLALLGGEELGKRKKTMLRAVIVVGSLFVVISQFNVVIYTLCAFALFLGTRELLHAQALGTKIRVKNVLRNSYIRTALALLFLTAITFVAYMEDANGNARFPGFSRVVSYIPNTMGVQVSELRPGAVVTKDMAVAGIAENPYTGTGPTSFPYLWAKYKPQLFASTDYFAVDFVYGLGYIPTMIATMGILGLVALLALYIGVLALLIKNILRTKDRDIFWFSLIGLYLAIIAFFYIPGISILAITAIILGSVFSLFGGHRVHVTARTPKIAVYVLLAIVSLIVLYTTAIVIKKNIASVFYARSVAAILEKKDLSLALPELTRAVKIDTLNPVFLQSLAEGEMLKIGIISNEFSKKAPSEEEGKQAQEAVRVFYSNAVALAKKALEVDSNNYTRYIFAAAILEMNPATQGEAAELYTQSLLLYPHNPFAYFGLAKTSSSGSDMTATKKYLEKALELRPQHSESLAAFVQIALKEGNVDIARKALQNGYKTDPKRLDILLELAKIEYSESNKSGAKEILEYTVSRDSTYVDALYALAVLYAEGGEFKKSSELLTIIQTNNTAASAQITPLLDALSQNRNPFVSKEEAPQPKGETKTETVKK